MLKHTDASVLTIGTEVVTGQIENRNARWITDHLNNLSISTVCHLSVADDEKQILDALEFCSRRSGIILCTGGLGPTRDDMTRDVIAHWTGKPLVFDEQRWKDLSTRISHAGSQVAESNRRQCYFPEGASVYENKVGTADAFSVEHMGILIVALPGPPHEIGAIWPQLQASLNRQIPLQDNLKLFRFHCLGLSESRLGELVEKVLAGSRLVSGYRPHIPYVEVKVWAPQSYLHEARPYLERLEKALAPWIVGRDDEDLAQEILTLLAGLGEVQLIDAVTQGQLINRLGKSTLTGNKVACDLTGISRITGEFGVDDWSELPEELLPSNTTVLAIYAGEASGTWEIVFQREETTHRATMQLPFRLEQSKELRAARYIAETSLKVWREWLIDCVERPELDQ